jgi:hypothetical protein
VVLVYWNARAGYWDCASWRTGDGGQIYLSPADRLVHHRSLGRTLAGQQKYDEAIVQLSEALRLQPGHMLFRTNLGDAFLAVGRNDEAIDLQKSSGF